MSVRKVSQRFFFMFCLLAPLAPVLGQDAGRVVIADSSTGDDIVERTGWTSLFWQGRGVSGGGFFYVSGIDGAEETENNFKASWYATSGRGGRMSFKRYERTLSAGTHRLHLSAKYVFAAPVEALFRSSSSFKANGEVEVELLAGERYRVIGALETYRQEVWLENVRTGEVVGRKVVNQDVEDARNRAMAGASYTCCNLRYDGEWISDNHPTDKPFIPAGARVVVRETGRHRVHVLIDGREMTFGHDYGSRLESRDSYIAKLMVKEDPQARIAAFPSPFREAVLAGRVMPGMSREQVILSLGYPRIDMTPTLETKVWKFWSGDGYEYEVVWNEAGVVGEIRSEEAGVPPLVTYRPSN